MSGAMPTTCRSKRGGRELPNRALPAKRARKPPLNSLAAFNTLQQLLKVYIVQKAIEDDLLQVPLPTPTTTCFKKDNKIYYY